MKTRRRQATARELYRFGMRLFFCCPQEWIPPKQKMMIWFSRKIWLYVAARYPVARHHNHQTQRRLGSCENAGRSRRMNEKKRTWLYNTPALRLHCLGKEITWHSSSLYMGTMYLRARHCSSCHTPIHQINSHREPDNRRRRGAGEDNKYRDYAFLDFSVFNN